MHSVWPCGGKDAGNRVDHILPGNVRFCDCEKLAAATPEQWVRLGEQKPGCIVLDCYHELSAVCWAQSVQKLLRM